MLTPYERAKSLAHKNLRLLHGYNKISDFGFNIPEIVAEKEILGVYINRDKTNIFFATDGILIEASNVFVAYQDVEKVIINLDKVSKHDVETIALELRNNKTLNLSILQPQFIADSGRRTQEVWSVYTFLRSIVNKQGLGS